MHTLREARMSDAPQIISLLDALDYPDTGAFINDRLLQLLSHPDEKLVVSVENDVVTGIISLHFIPQLALAGDFCRISYFCVSPEARGKGTGKALEAYAVDIATQRGCDRMEVHSHSRRIDAHRFYSRQGYSESPKYLFKSLKKD